MRFNHLHPPFDNAAARRAVLGVIDQAEFMTASTEDRSPWRDRVGVFTPGTPMANEVGCSPVRATWPARRRNSRPPVTAANLWSCCSPRISPRCRQTRWSASMC
jgi:hypothetical protein